MTLADHDTDHGTWLQIRIRNILIAAPGKLVRDVAATRVGWISDSAVVELEQALSRDLGLNAEQRRYLVEAAHRSISLLHVSCG